MPWQAPRTLTDDEVYAVTAYLLAINGLIDEDEVMNAETLPAVQMPNRDGFIPGSRSGCPEPGGRARIAQAGDGRNMSPCVAAASGEASTWLLRRSWDAYNRTLRGWYRSKDLCGEVSKALDGLPRFIATTTVADHRLFVWARSWRLR